MRGHFGSLYSQSNQDLAPNRVVSSVLANAHTPGSSRSWDLRDGSARNIFCCCTPFRSAHLFELLTEKDETCERIPQSLRISTAPNVKVCHLFDSSRESPTME